MVNTKTERFLPGRVLKVLIDMEIRGIFLDSIRNSLEFLILKEFTHDELDSMLAMIQDLIEQVQSKLKDRVECTILVSRFGQILDDVSTKDMTKLLHIRDLIDLFIKKNKHTSK